MDGGSHWDVLLVEDNPNDVELARHEFGKNGIAECVQIVRDGVAALQFLFCEGEYAERPPVPQPRLVLLDLKLPRLDGLEVLRRIKEDPRTRWIPVVVLTTSNEESDIRSAWMSGANSYVVKSIDYQGFAASLRRVLEYWLTVNQLPVDRLPGANP